MNVHLSRGKSPNTLIVRFEYHPAIIAAVKDVPGREWSGETKHWIIPLNPDNVLSLQARIAGMGHSLSFTPELRDELNARWKATKEAAAIRAAGDHDLAFDYVTEPYAHQRAGLGFLARLGSGGLFWEMGLGKTKTAIDFAEWLATGGSDGDLRAPGNAGTQGVRGELASQPQGAAGGVDAALPAHREGARGAPAALRGGGPVQAAGDHGRTVRGGDGATEGPVRDLSGSVHDGTAYRSQPSNGTVPRAAVRALQSSARAVQGRSGADAASDGARLRVLVVAPNTVCRNWGAEIEKHAGHMDYQVLTGMTIPNRIKNLGSSRYSIVNCEALSIKAFAKAAQAIEWDLVIVDESTRFKSPKAERTKQLHKLRRKHAVVLTGTPITGKPEDAWSQLEFVAPGTFGKSYWGFEQHFLDVNKYTHEVRIRPERVDELKQRIDRHGYRILKSQVLDLPEKVYASRRVELTPEQRRYYNSLRDELRLEIETREISVNNVLTMLLRLTQITAGLVGEGRSYVWLPDNAKAKELDSLLNDELRGEQVVIFGVYQRELEELARRYTFVPGIADLGRREAEYAGKTGMALPIIYGPTPERVRHELVEQFQAGTRRLLFCQIKTGGIGINLTAAQTAIYVTRDWSLEAWLQSQDRLHRIGQKGTVSIVSLEAEGTIDQEISKALVEKQNMADSLTGDKARRLAQQILER